MMSVLLLVISHVQPFLLISTVPQRSFSRQMQTTGDPDPFRNRSNLEFTPWRADEEVWFGLNQFDRVSQLWND